MKGFQTKLDVIGNNIANVNTSGFKKGRVTFQDMMSQTMSGAQGPAGDRGGVNPAQVGLGSQVGTIDNIHTQGFLETTSNPLDLAIEGDGMFALKTPDGTAYTRAGNFYLDDEDYLVNADGYYVLNNKGDEIQIPKNAKSINIEKDGSVHYIADDKQEKADDIGIAMFSNPAGLDKIGENLYLDTNNAGFNGVGIAESGGSGSVTSGTLEMSNVDLSEEFTEMITAQRGFQANTRIITTSDEILQELVNLKR